MSLSRLFLKKEISSYFELLSIISRDLRSSITETLKLSKEIEKKVISPEEKTDFILFKKSMESLLFLINDILIFNTSTINQPTDKNLIINFQTLKKEITTLLLPIALERKIKFSVKIYPKVPEQLAGKKLMLDFTLINLLNKVIRYAKGDEVSLSIYYWKTKGQKIYLNFMIQNTGSDFEHHQFETLFEPEFIARALEEEFLDSMGLPLVKYYTKFMKGEIFIDNRTERTFRLQLIVPFQLPKLPNQA